MNYLGLLSILGRLVLLFLLSWRIAKKLWTPRQITAASVLAALAVIGRIPFVIISGMQPTTFFVILAGLHLGPLGGFAVGQSAALLSNFFLGQGPWTLWQMLGWGLCGFSAGVLARFPLHRRSLVLAGFGFAWGFLYGWILNFWNWLAYIEPLTFETWLSVNAISAPSDFVHGLTNAVLLWLVAPAFLKILQRYS